MIRHVRWMLLVALAVVVGCSGGVADAPGSGARSDALSANRARHVTILHVNDTHGHLDAFGPKDASLDGVLGGMTKAATVIERVRKSAPDALLVHAGDIFEGDYFFNLGFGQAGIPELGLMKELGFDVLTLGNHEFNYGPDLLGQVLKLAAFDRTDVLSANLLPPPGPTPLLATLVKPHTVRTVDGVRIGFFGLTQPYDLLEQPSPFTLVGDPDHPLAPLLAIAQQEIATLRSPSFPGGAVDLVVLVSHLGNALDQGLAAALPASSGGIDVILGGHDHFEITFEEYVPGKTIVVQAGQFYEKVGQLDLVYQKGRLLAASHRLVPVDASVKRDPTVSAEVQALKAAIVAQVNGYYHLPAEFDFFHTPVAFATGLLGDAYDPAGTRRDTDLGALAADALQQQLGAQFGFLTQGFVSDKVYPGVVVADDLFRAFPYGINPRLFGMSATDAILVEPVTTCTVTPPQLFTGMVFGIQNGEIPQVSSNVRVTYDPAHLVETLSITVDGGNRISYGSWGNVPSYRVATNVFVGYVLGLLAGPVECDVPAADQLSVLLGYVANHPVLSPAAGRVFVTGS